MADDGSQHNMECSGCRALRKEVEELKSTMFSSARPMDEDAQCNSTYISERKQMEIDKLLMDERHKAETFQEAYEKELQEKHTLQAANSELKRQLDEMSSEVAVLKQQNAVYVSDFRLEREDRERSQSRLTELEEQLAAASRRIAELEDDRQRLLATRHQNPSIPTYRGYVAEPAPSYSEHHHLPAYSVHQPAVTHHAHSHPRQMLPTSYPFGRDVCDRSDNDSHNVASVK